MAPVMPLTAPSTLDVHNTFLRDQPLNPNNCSPNNNNKNNNNNENNNNNSNRQQQEKVPCQNGGTKQQQQEEVLPCQNGETKQEQQHSEQEGLNRAAAVAPEQTVLGEGDNEDLNGSFISGRTGIRASLDITIANQALRRKVSWSDTRGNDLVQIWEFQPSDSSDSDDDGEDDSQACACVIV